MIDIRNLKKVFQNGETERVLFRDFTFQMNPGEMIAIMGKSGSGKTTLLNIIGLIEDFNSGEYLFNDRNVKEFSPKEILQFRRQNVSFVFQNFALIEDYNVLNNILLPLYYRYGNRKKHIALAEEIAENLEIHNLLHRSIDKLSGGEKQRVAIARALITQPEVILADEPTGALDDENSGKLLDLLLRLHRTGQSIILVTHDEGVASQCQRIVNI